MPAISAPTPRSTASLHAGSAGTSVRQLQQQLNAQGFDCGTADGKYGPKTEQAVRRFQQARGLPVDGVAGAATMRALNAAPAPSPAPAPAPAPAQPAPRPPTGDSGEFPPVSGSYEREASAAHALLNRPADLDTSASEKIAFLKTGAPRISPKPLTEAEGRQLFFEGMLPGLANAAAFKKDSPTVAQTPSYARGAPCAYSTSWRMEQACLRAGRPDLAKIFKNHDAHAVTHEVEIALKNMGFTYYSKRDYEAPRGAIGMWSRYTFHGVKQHSGHIYSILEDKGVDGRADRMADNNGAFDHTYKPEGKCEGFWLPPGVYPERRG